MRRYAGSHDIAQYLFPIPPCGLKGFDESVRLALNKVRDADVETRRSTAMWTPADPLPTDPQWSRESVYLDRRERDVDAPPEDLWRVVVGIGGETGWYSFAAAWSVPGWLDNLVGGVGLKSSCLRALNDQ
jgi:hypothetical protein